MPKLRADFRSDLLAIARQHLVADWGEQTRQVSDDDVLIKFFDSWRRRPSIRPWRLWVADDFQCPREHTEGWRQLQRKIVGGEDLCPHLSRRARATRYRKYCSWFKQTREGRSQRFWAALIAELRPHGWVKVRRHFEKIK